MFPYYETEFVRGRYWYRPVIMTNGAEVLWRGDVLLASSADAFDQARHAM